MSPIFYNGGIDAHKCLCACEQAALNEFSGFKSEGALRLGRSQNQSLAARVAAQATSVRSAHSDCDLKPPSFRYLVMQKI